MQHTDTRHRQYARYRKHIFTVTFLVFQLVFCLMLIYYILKKHQVSFGFLGQIIN